MQIEAIFNINLQNYCKFFSQQKHIKVLQFLFPCVEMQLFCQTDSSPSKIKMDLCETMLMAKLLMIDWGKVYFTLSGTIGQLRPRWHMH